MGSQLFTTTGANTWNWPTGVTTVTVELIGGGGAGGGATGNPAAGGGGHGGGYSKKAITKGVETSLTITIGTGGVGGTTTAGASATVSTTTQNGSIVQTANAGANAATNATTTTGAGATTVIGTASGDTTFSGGNGATAATTSGSGGGAGGPTGAGGAGTATTSGGGARGTGTWGDGSTTRSGTGANGVAASAAGLTPVVGTVGYGGGGSGGAAATATDRASGNGAQGVGLLTWTDPPAAFTQSSFRLYADGTESASTALAAQDTNYTADISGGNFNLGLRFRLQETVGTAGLTTDDYQLMVSKNGGSYTTLQTIFTSYAESHGTNPVAIFGSDGKTGQCFTPVATWSVGQASVFLSKLGAPTGNITLEIWAVDVAHKPTGSVLGTSDTVNIVNITTTQQLQQFNFSTPVSLTSGVEYALIVVYTGGDASNSLKVGYDPAGTYGTVAPFLSGGVWTIDSADDMAFYLLASGAGTVPFDSTNFSQGDATTNRLTGGTGVFVAGKISESVLINDLQVTASNFTELLFSVQLVAANLANNDTLDFRVYRNGSAINTYTITPRITASTTPSATTVSQLGLLGVG